MCCGPFGYARKTGWRSFVSICGTQHGALRSSAFSGVLPSRSWPAGRRSSSSGASGPDVNVMSCGTRHAPWEPQSSCVSSTLLSNCSGSECGNEAWNSGLVRRGSPATTSNSGTRSSSDLTRQKMRCTTPHLRDQRRPGSSAQLARHPRTSSLLPTAAATTPALSRTARSLPTQHVAKGVLVGPPEHLQRHLGAGQHRFSRVADVSGHPSTVRPILSGSPPPTALTRTEAVLRP